MDSNTHNIGDLVVAPANWFPPNFLRPFLFSDSEKPVLGIIFKTEVAWGVDEDNGQLWYYVIWLEKQLTMKYKRDTITELKNNLAKVAGHTEHDR